MIMICTQSDMEAMRQQHEHDIEYKKKLNELEIERTQKLADIEVLTPPCTCIFFLFSAIQVFAYAM
jgi:hypothetical protein